MSENYLYGQIKFIMPEDKAVGSENNQTQNKACCFTGYRENKFSFAFNPGQPEYDRFEFELMRVIKNAVYMDNKVFYNGAAYGFDILAAETLIRYKDEMDSDVRLICVIPFISQQENWNGGWQRRYNKVLNEADEVIVLSENYFTGCYHARNKYMVDRSDMAITYFDGIKGGTQNTIQYAKKRGLKIINIYDSLKSKTDENGDVSNINNLWLAFDELE